MELFSNGSSNTCISNPSLENLIMLPTSRFGLPLFVLTQKKMHMNQSLHTISKNVGLLLTDKTPINELFNKTIPEKESTDYYMPSLFGLEDF